MSVMDELLDILNLEPIELNLFRGRSPADETAPIFGGQVVAQALTAAYKTVEGRICHSLQSYFIRGGDPSIPVLYQVERSRDGRSFSTRRVIATQHGEQIFNMACSFHVAEESFEHQDAMPDTPRPETLRDDRERWLELLPADSERRARFGRERPIELRSVEPVNWMKPEPAPAPNRVWVRARADCGDDVALNHAFLAYASDYSLLATSLRPHGVLWSNGAQTASLDHIVWFHRPTNFARWHLYVQDSPSASGARGFNRGAIYREDGVLAASVAQEALIRRRRN